MKFLGFSRLIPAIAAMFTGRNRQQAASPASDIRFSVQISNSGGWNPAEHAMTFPKPTPCGEYHPVKNQRKQRKALRRRLAAGFNG